MTQDATRPCSRGRPSIVWAAPAVALFGAFGILPIAMVVWLSFTTWNGLGDPHWTGLTNWRAMADDPDIVSGVWRTLLLAGLAWVIQTPLALLIGVWSTRPGRGRAAVSAFLAVPLLLSTVAIALAWLALLDPNFGIAASLGKFVGVPDGNFLGHPTRALVAIALVTAWQYIPFHTLIYQAGAHQIPAVLYEAAQLDGAGPVRRFFSITLPQLRNTVVASSIVMTVGTLTGFEGVLLLTNGGPGTATRILPLHMYIKGFVSFNMGYASAVAVLLVVLGTLIAVTIVRATGYQRMTSEAEGL